MHYCIKHQLFLPRKKIGHHNMHIWCVTTLVRWMGDVGRLWCCIHDSGCSFDFSGHTRATIDSVVMNKTTNHPASSLAGAIQPYWPNTVVAPIEFYNTLLAPICKALSKWPERRLREA